jgi:hypothetical protein
MTGRPSVMTPEMQQVICLRIAEGETIRQIANDDEMPAASTIYLAVANDEAFSEQYARAREAQLARWEDEIIEIADDGSNDWVERERRDGSTETVADQDHINRSKLRVDARKWIMSKRLPKKYGDKVTQEVTGANGTPLVPIINLTGRPEPSSTS